MSVNKTKLEIEEENVRGGSRDEMNSDLFSRRVDGLPQQEVKMDRQMLTALFRSKKGNWFSYESKRLSLRLQLIKKNYETSSPTAAVTEWLAISPISQADRLVKKTLSSISSAVHRPSVPIHTTADIKQNNRF